MKELAERLTDLARLVGKDEKMDAFTTQYEALLRELTAAQKTMRALATTQGAWLSARLGTKGKDN
jgi:uncharacterized protein YecT (DUF1311 family)